MRLVLELDGERREVDVDAIRSTVRIGTHEWPVQIGPIGPDSVSFEILGERIEVRAGNAEQGRASRSITINGEVHTLSVESNRGATRDVVRPHSTGRAPPSDRSSERVGVGNEERAVLPPMPGKVLEVRVRNGEKVRAGQVLVVVEAMKMRNEVTAPVGGEVEGLSVVPGANVAARDVLLRLRAS